MDGTEGRSLFALEWAADRRPSQLVGAAAVGPTSRMAFQLEQPERALLILIQLAAS